jgi:XTP/dITP diphosphohydrolase
MPACASKTNGAEFFCRKITPSAFEALTRKHLMHSNPRQCVLASANSGKLAEMQAFFDLAVPGQLQLSRLCDFTPEQAIENGESFVENALIKARFAAKIAGMPALADDSGLCVPALGGAPGIHSAHFAGAHGNDARNNALLLEKMQGMSDRSAFFVSVCVWVEHALDPMPVIAQGLWAGEILRVPRGALGFGYDPIFYDPRLARSAAEMSLEEKNRCSHRAQALTHLLRAMRAQGVLAL